MLDEGRCSVNARSQARAGIGLCLLFVNRKLGQLLFHLFWCGRSNLPAS